jgi:hypothetical protein
MTDTSRLLRALPRDLAALGQMVVRLNIRGLEQRMQESFPRDRLRLAANKEGIVLYRDTPTYSVPLGWWPVLNYSGETRVARPFDIANWVHGAIDLHALQVRRLG